MELHSENRLVCLKDHAVVHLEVLVEVEPGAVGGGLVVEAVGEDPGVLVGHEGHRRLVLREQLVVDADVAVRGTPDDDALPCVLLFVVVDLSCRRSSKDLELQLDRWVICVDVEVSGEMNLLVLAL